MNGDLGWLWIVLAFILIALLIGFLGRRKDAGTARMAHPAPHEGADGLDTPVEAAAAGAAAASENLTALDTTSERVVLADSGDDLETADDLEIIEGIGPKIASLLRQSGIRTFAQLATIDVPPLEQILSDARLRHLADPETWPKQAALAAERRWDELKTYQETLKGGHAA